MGERVADPMPTLVAHVSDPNARAFLTGIARDEGGCYIALVSAPVATTVHTLDVHVRDGRPPLRLLAEPLGATTAKGTPLRLRFVPTNETLQEIPSSAPPPASGFAPASDPLIGR